MIIRMCFALFVAILLVGCDKLSTGKSQSTSSPSPQSNVGDGVDWNNPLLRPTPPPASAANDGRQYQLHVTPDGKIFRLNTQSGQVSLVTDKGLKTLPDDRSIQLRVGQIYTLENGKSAIYDGNEKLNSDTRRIADALVEKYSNVTPMSELDTEIARRKADPLGIRK